MKTFFVVACLILLAACASAQRKKDTCLEVNARDVKHAQKNSFSFDIHLPRGMHSTGKTRAIRFYPTDTKPPGHQAEPFVGVSLNCSAPQSYVYLHSEVITDGTIDYVYVMTAAVTLKMLKSGISIDNAVADFGTTTTFSYTVEMNDTVKGSPLNIKYRVSASGDGSVVKNQVTTLGTQCKVCPTTSLSKYAFTFFNGTCSATTNDCSPFPSLYTCSRPYMTDPWSRECEKAGAHECYNMNVPAVLTIYAVCDSASSTSVTGIIIKFWNFFCIDEYVYGGLTRKLGQLDFSRDSNGLTNITITSCF